MIDLENHNKKTHKNTVTFNDNNPHRNFFY